MPRRNWKGADYNEITHKRMSKKWSEEKMKQVMRDARAANKENRDVRRKDNKYDNKKKRGV